MLKLSKIYKVFLSATLLLAFSGIEVYAGEYETCLKTCESYPTDKKGNPQTKKIEKCKQQCTEAEKARQQKADLLGAGGWQTTQRSSSQITGAERNGSGMVVRTKTGTRTEDAAGNKITKDANGNYVDKDGNSLSQWEQASLKKKDAQNEYTQASKDYNKCVAQKGAAACSSEKKAMDEKRTNLDSATTTYNQAQKDASKAYYEDQKAQAKADKAAAKAEAAALKADQKELKNAQKEVDKIKKEINKCKKKAADDAAKQKCEDDYKEKLEAAQKNANEAQGKVDGHTKASDSGNSGEKSNTTRSDVDIARDIDKVSAELKQAEADCEKYSAMTSKDAQARAKETCAKAVQLEAQKKALEEEQRNNREKLEALNKEVENTKKAYEECMEKNNNDQEACKSELEAYQNAQNEAGNMNSTINSGGAKYSGVEAASMRLKATNADYSANGGGYGVVDISQSRELKSISNKGVGEGYNFSYGSGSDVLETITRRAALAIVGLKPIVYVFAGFGLIAFAWMAIFGKLSWKWFANIAMGLFLVANMGRFIEYFVAGGSDYHYYVGEWTNGAKPSGTSGSKSNQLANAFHDIYYVYGDTTYNAKGLRDYVNEEDIQSTESSDSFTPNARGFCQGTSASGWANFTSCLKDIVATGKKAVDAVQTVKATVEDVKARVETVADTISNIKDAVNNIHSFSDVINSTGTILSNVNSAVSTTTGAVGSLTNAASRVSNDVQDLGKSVEQQQELADRRALGEATNAFDAKLKGQEFNKVTGGVENVDGHYAGEENVLTNIQNAAKNIKDKTSTLNTSAQDAAQQASSVVNIIDGL